MAKKDKAPVDGMTCFKKKEVTGSLRFPNRIIKPGQKFWAFEEDIPDAFMDQIEETSPDKKAVVVNLKEDVKRVPPPAKGEQPVDDTPKFDLAEAKDEEGKNLKQGNKKLWNVVSLSDGEVMNPKPLLKGKAAELLETLNS